MTILTNNRSTRHRVSLGSKGGIIITLGRTNCASIRLLSTTTSSFVIAVTANNFSITFVTVRKTNNRSNTVRNTVRALNVPCATSNILTDTYNTSGRISGLLCTGTNVPVTPNLTLRAKNRISVSRVIRIYNGYYFIGPTIGNSDCNVSLIRRPSRLPTTVTGTFRCNSGILIRGYVRKARVAMNICNRSRIHTLPVIRVHGPRSYRFCSLSMGCISPASVRHVPTRVSPRGCTHTRRLTYTTRRTLNYLNVSHDSFVIDRSNPIVLRAGAVPNVASASLCPSRVHRASSVAFPRIYSNLVHVNLHQTNVTYWSEAQFHRRHHDLSSAPVPHLPDTPGHDPSTLSEGV